MKALWNFIRGYCYVVIANEDQQVKECKVFYTYNKADKQRDKYIKAYGGQNVCLASRKINSKI